EPPGLPERTHSLFGLPRLPGRVRGRIAWTAPCDCGQRARIGRREPDLPGSSHQPSVLEERSFRTQVSRLLCSAPDAGRQLLQLPASSVRPPGCLAVLAVPTAAPLF